MRLSKLIIFVFTATLCTAFSPIAGALPQNPTPAQTATPPGNNTPLIQPSSLSGAEDKSYVSFSALGVNFAMGLQADDTALVSREKLEIPLTLYSGNARLVSNRDLTSFAPEFSYMDVLSGIEWSLQDLTVFETDRTVSGPGISLRFDLSSARFRWVRSYNTYRRSLSPTPEERALAPTPPKGVVRFRKQKSKPLFDSFLDDFIASARAPRLSAFLTHQWLDGSRLASVGLSLSQVLPAHHYDDESKIKNVWGIVPRIALQGLGEDLTQFQATEFMQPRYSRSVRTSLGLAVQDNVPHLLYSNRTAQGFYPGDLQIARWRYQIGLEYVYRNVVDGDESYGLYARLRSLNNHNEVSVSISRTPLKDVQFGVSFSITTDGDLYPTKKKDKTPGK